MAKKICLDAGHYGKYNRSPVVKEYYESEMNWKLHLKLKKYLEQHGFEVILTRGDQKKDMELTARGKASKGCDLFLSIHSNACDTQSVDYPVVYVPLNGTGDKIGKELADCIYNTMKTKQKGRTATRKGNRGDYYGVIRGAVSVGVPGLILEHSFHTNTKATKWLMVDSNLEQMAKAEADVIANYFDVKIPTTTTAVYRVQVGAYSTKKNAEAQLDKVKSAGFDAFIAVVDGKLFRVQVGAYSDKANAEKQLAKVKAAGFSAFITQNSGEAVAKKSNTEIAKEVIQGKWGNGEDRKKRLTSAGYDYSAVQKEVNRLLK